LLRLLGAIATTVLVLAAWLGFRLSEGPLALSFLQPYIEEALTSPDGRFSVKVDATVLAWNREATTVELQALDVRAMAGATVVASVPEISVSLSALSLLKGVVAPRSLRIFHPRIRLVRDAAGQFQFGMGQASDTPPDTGDGSTEAVEELFAALLTPPGGDSVAGQLQRVEILGADLLIEDQSLHHSWHAPQADLRFLRDRVGIQGHARIDLDLDGEPARISADGLYRSDQRVIDALASYGGLRPERFASLAPQLAPLAALQLPTGGSVGVTWSLDDGLQALRFDLAGGAGVIDASTQLGVSIPVASLALRGALTDKLSKVVLDEARLDLGGPLVTLSGHAEDIATAAKVDLSARIDDLPVDQLKGLWPPSVAPNPRAWILTNLSHGRVRLATAHVTGHVPAGKSADDIAIDSLGGEVVPEGLTVQYLAPMPVVKNVNAVATFDQNQFVITIKSGELMGLRVQDGGKVALTGLSAADQFADISIKIGGPISDALRVIDSKPLNWAKTLGIEPGKIAGEAVTQLDLKFPLLQNLTFDGLKVHAEAQTNHVGIPDVALGLDLADGALALDVDPKGLDVTGKGRLGGIPAEIKWRENFSHGAPFRSRYQVAGSLDDAARRLVGLDTAPFQAPFVQGTVPVEVVATLNDGGRGDIDVKARLDQTMMSLPGLNWAKKPGQPGQATATIRLAGGRLAEVPQFAVSAADGLEVRGQVGFDNGKARRVSFSHAKWGRSEAKGTLAIKPDGAGLVIEVTGNSFDAREILSGSPSDQPLDAKQKAAERKKPKEETVPLSVTANFAEVWVSDEGQTHDTTVTFQRDNRGDTRQLHLDAKLGPAGQGLHLEITPAPGNKRAVRLTSGDAGAVFRTFGVFNNVTGGQLAIDAAYDDSQPRQPLAGVITVHDYQVMKAPALARLLTVAALTGIVDLLSGDGIHFSTLEAPFTLTDGVLDLRDARASGTELGLTIKGQVDLDQDVVALEGTIVPAYAINSVLGHIPLVGSLFSAEKGGGIIAMNYSMRGPSADPSISVNPLSALTPGFLRKLFDIFDNGTETKVRTEEK
jgi:uncharacterized protein YhdP